jgi:hypothetical protein
MRRAMNNLRVFNGLYLGSMTSAVSPISADGRFAMVVVGNYRNRAELRKKPRRQFHYNARILIDKKVPSIPCSISDISESGARLAIERDEDLPETFMLLFTANGGARRQCRVVWRTGVTLGVEFPDHQ